jgi:hypothetical protein
MTNTSIFKAVADLVTGAKARETEEHARFLRFYRDLVETLPTAATKAFGGLSLADATRIELTATDYIWWKNKIEQQGYRFSAGVFAVQANMLNHLAKKAEAERLDPAERKALLALLDEAQSEQAA